MENNIIEHENSELKIAPESLEIAEIYMQSLDIGETATTMNLPQEVVVSHLEKREVKKYLDAVFFDRGYMNRHKLASTLDDIIAKKLEELEEAEMTSSKDIAELLKLAMDFRSQEAKMIEAEAKINLPQTQQNIQVNAYGTNYSNLLKAIIEGGFNE